ncbi:DUF3592 domain-containing protein [Cyanobium sp. Copco_Reservoir_LC18]|uniref:DUF3592 domain-containing protein n=1 Tax=Cyanobium sp. Copco_Reservoir_LC18 TaxID=1328305 RepID=UPI00135C4BBF
MVLAVDDAHLETAKPILRYRYQLGSRSYIGFHTSSSGYGVSRAAMEAVVRPYAQGSVVRVCYNPGNPGTAVLDITATSDWLYRFVFGVGFLLLADF